jgi:hypothetical protein
MSAKTPRAPCRAAQGGLTRLVLWLGWLRSFETFHLLWRDFDIVEPPDGPSADLPLRCGAIRICLGPETRSSHNKTVSVPIAYHTLSGYHCGKWFHQARHCGRIGADYRDSTNFVFLHPNGHLWTSYYYLQEFLYPSLRRQQAAGDPMLLNFGGTPGNTLQSKF